MHRSLLALASMSLVAGCQTSMSSSHSAERSPESSSGGPLVAAYHVQPVCNGITFSRDGRAFACFPKPDGGGAATVCEVGRDGTLTPYPTLDAHTWKPGDADAAKKIIRANSIRFDGAGRLWIVDTGTPANGAPVVPGGPKLVCVDVNANAIVATIPLDSVVKEKSFVDDVRFGDRAMYATDAGVPALIVIDYATGQMRRVLENDQSTTSRDMYADGKLLKKPTGEKVMVHADQLEVSPDGSLLYFMPCSGPCSTIETKYLDDASLNDDELRKHVKLFVDNPTIGGTAMDADGNLYFDDVDHQQVFRVTPDGTATTIIKDETRPALGRRDVDRRRRLPVDSGCADGAHAGHERRDRRRAVPDHDLQAEDRQAAAAAVNARVTADRCRP